VNHLSDATLQALVDGALDAAAQTSATDHLAGCATCSSLHAEYASLFGDLAQLEVPTLPPRFAAAVMARVDVRERLLARQRAIAAFTLVGSALVGAGCFLLAGNGAWARQLSELFASALQVTRLGQVLLTAVQPALRAFWMPLFAAAAGLCLPTLLALYRSILPRAQAA
jgi:anti-sigma factor RsiW